ncbi:unnamed protein product [Dovyalis caffra]|uniref:Uncharacterized protein n=1 Tax=Dovyalis caffra TaxID=77055 RepID=A0AAV1S9U4_9ROSI|nr:unnamed protein product [Dovyalis caffra]
MNIPAQKASDPSPTCHSFTHPEMRGLLHRRSHLRCLYLLGEEGLAACRYKSLEHGRMVNTRYGTMMAEAPSMPLRPPPKSQYSSHIIFSFAGYLAFSFSRAKVSNEEQMNPSTFADANVTSLNPTTSKLNPKRVQPSELNRPSKIPVVNTSKKVGTGAWGIPLRIDSFQSSSDASLFSCSLPVLPHEKLNFNDSENYGRSIDDSPPNLNKLDLETEVTDLFEDVEPNAIGNLLPDDDELLAGIMDDFDLSGLPSQLEDLEECDLFGPGGGWS